MIILDFKKLVKTDAISSESFFFGYKKKKHNNNQKTTISKSEHDGLIIVTLLRYV